MERTPVSSSSLKSVGYDPRSQTLEIEFETGRTYQYFNVPESIYQALMSAGSHGQYFNQNIKGSYPSERIN